MSYTIIMAGLMAFLIAWTSYFIAQARCQKQFDKEIAECRAEHDCQLSQAKNKLRDLSCEHEKLKKDYEILLKEKESYRERYLKTLDQKYKLQNHSNQFKKELYKARKRIKQCLGSKQK